MRTRNARTRAVRIAIALAIIAPFVWAMIDITSNGLRWGSDEFILSQWVAAAYAMVFILTPVGVALREFAILPICRSIAGAVRQWIENGD